jgi:hypothetical protein
MRVLHPDRCHCRCHNWPRGTQRACSHDGNYMTAFDWAQRASVWDAMANGVDATDPLEAVMACAACLNAHCPALSGRPFPIVPRQPREQADGWIDPPSPNDS